MRKNRWLYGRNDLIDFHSLTMDEQTMARLRVRPTPPACNSDQLPLTLLVQNTSSDTIVPGQASEIRAAFPFPFYLGKLDDRSYIGLITTIDLHQRTKRT